MSLTAVACGPQNAAPSRTPPAPVDRVDVVALEAEPTALNWDDAPGLDGVKLRVTFFQMAQPQPVLGSGTVDILLFEKPVSKASVATTKPFFTWSFTARNMSQFYVRDMVGWRYVMPLSWGGRPPHSGDINLVARYRAASGAVIYSDIVSVAMTAK